MKVIHKKQLEERGIQVISLQTGSQIISVQEQLGIICIWYICDRENKLSVRTIHIFMTGQELPKDISTLKFIGTVITADNFVLHVFEGDLP